MEKEKQRLSSERKTEIIDNFRLEQGTTQFNVGDIINYLSDLDEYKKLSPKQKYNKAAAMVISMRKKYPHEFETIQSGHRGTPAIWRFTKVFMSIEETSEKKTGHEKQLEKLYNLINYAASSKIGVSKEDAGLIIGYKSKMNESVIESLNDQYEKITGLRPLKIDRRHIYVESDTIFVEKDESSLILEDLMSKLKTEPTLPTFESKYVDTVKEKIRKDYYMLLMFKPKCKLSYYGVGSDAKKFKEYIVSRNSVSAEEVAERFTRRCKERYGIELTELVGIPREGYTINKEELDQALSRIKKVFKEYFNEDLIDEETVEERKKESVTITDYEKYIIKIIEKVFFNGKSGGMYLSDIWKKFDEVHIPRGWDLSGLIKKFPERFKINEHMPRPGTGSESFVTYEAEPEPVKEVEIIKEVPVYVPVYVEPPKPKNLYIVVGFKNKIDSLSDIRGFLEINDFQKYHEDYLYKIGIDLENKKSVLEFLKIYYQSLKTDDIVVVYEDIPSLVKKLEGIILND